MPYLCNQHDLQDFYFEDKIPLVPAFAALGKFLQTSLPLLLQILQDPNESDQRNRKDFSVALSTSL